MHRSILTYTLAPVVVRQVAYGALTPEASRSVHTAKLTAQVVSTLVVVSTVSVLVSHEAFGAETAVTALGVLTYRVLPTRAVQTLVYICRQFNKFNARVKKMSGYF